MYVEDSLFRCTCLQYTGQWALLLAPEHLVPLTRVPHYAHQPVQVLGPLPPQAVVALVAAAAAGAALHAASKAVLRPAGPVIVRGHHQGAARVALAAAEALFVELQPNHRQSFLNHGEDP